MDQRTLAVIRVLIAACAAAVLFGYCSIRSTIPSVIQDGLGLPDMPPAHGTDHPLDSARLSRVLADPERIRAAIPLGAGLEPGVWADHARLSWLWSTVQRVEGATDSAWVRGAKHEIAEAADALRQWPIPGVTGPGEMAAVLRAVPNEELQLIAARRAEIAAFFAALHPPIDENDYLTVKPTDPEALGWLRQTEAAAGLAGNRFDSAEDGARFIEALYAAGATKVVITTESIQGAATNELYADAIRVVLPDDPAKRVELFRLLNAEVEREGYDVEADVGQGVFFMWWD